MKKRTVWLAFGLVAVMCATSLAGAMTLTNVHTAEASSTEEAAVSVETEVMESTEASDTAQTGETEEPATETETAEEETGALETEALETEALETETETEYEPELVAVAYEQDGAWGNVAIINSEKVETGVNIRSEADTESEILGYLYIGTAVWVIEKGNSWTQFYSNGITGYVMTDYLLFGDDVAEIAEVYGAEGVRADWDGVNVYTDTEGTTVKSTMEANDVFQVVNDYGHWIEIQYDEDSTAFVSSEDVTSVMLFESATPKDQERVELVKLYDVIWPETSVSEETYTEETEASSSDSSSTDSASSTTSSSSSSSTSETTATEAETTASTEAETTASTESTEAETSSSATDDDDDDDAGYYDADSDTYYDSDGNVVTSSLESDTAVATVSETEAETTASTEAETTASTEAETTASTETETTASTEAETTASTETETTASTEAETTASTEAETATTSSTAETTDDTTLLAALIYCEAGNQSYEGMVAVGAVVMNRVESSSFPNTISEVIYQSGQFSPASSGALATAIANGVPSTCYTAAAAAIAGEDPTDGALYFNTTANKGIQIGGHWFY